MKPIANPTMTTHCKCRSKEYPGSPSTHSASETTSSEIRESAHPRRSITRRLLEIGHCAISGIILLLMPKCPVCIAAYVAAFTGIGLSLSTASTLRILTLCLAGCSAIYLVAKHTRRRSLPATVRS